MREAGCDRGGGGSRGVVRGESWVQEGGGGLRGGGEACERGVRTDLLRFQNSFHLPNV